MPPHEQQDTTMKASQTQKTNRKDMQNLDHGGAQHNYIKPCISKCVYSYACVLRSLRNAGQRRVPDCLNGPWPWLVHGLEVVRLQKASEPLLDSGLKPFEFREKGRLIFLWVDNSENTPYAGRFWGTPPSTANAHF